MTIPRRRRFYPPYVSGFKDRHGKTRLRFRRKGFEPHYFVAAFGTAAFGVEYEACLAGRIDLPTAAIQRTDPGTIADLVTRFCAVPERLGPTATTQAKIRAILDRFREGREDRMVLDVQFEHIDAIIARKRKKVLVGKRMEGGVEAARKLRKELVRLFDFAVKIRMRPDNPVNQSDRVKVAAGDRSKGFYSWTEEDIAQFRAKHDLGTKARLAMELMLWTDQRRCDSIHLGRQHIKNGLISLTQSKGGKDLKIPVAPQLLEAIVAMPPAQSGHLCFLVTEWGKPFTNAGFGNWFRDRCDEAGLPQCSAHGLRKATMRRMAELGLSNQVMKGMSGHTKDDEVALYTAAANQQRIAETAVRALATWEMSNLASRLDISAEQVSEI